MSRGPIVGRLFRALERFLGLEAWRHGCRGARQHLVVLDAERAQPPLLPHGERGEIADLDQLRLAEMLVQTCPERIVDGLIPGDRLGVGKCRLLSLIIAARALEIDQVAVVLLDEALSRGLDGALVAAKLTQHRARDVDAAKLFDAVIGHPVLEYVAPAVGEGPEHGRYMGANCLTLRPRRAFAGATVELGKHRLVVDACGVDVAYAWLGHR